VEVLRHKGAASIPFLKRSMRQGDRDVRKLLLDALAGFQAGDATEIYGAALSDSDTNVVITAVENLGKTRATHLRPKIEELLLASGSHPMLVGACLEALAEIGDEQALAAIRRRFPELAALPDFFLSPCLKAIGALGTAEEFAQVAGLLPACRPHLRAAILGALISIHQRHPAKADGDVLLPAIRALVENGDRGPSLVSYQAVRALGFLSSRDDVYSFLIGCLSNSERLVRLGAIEALRASERPGLENVLAACERKESDEELLQALRC